MTQPLYTVYLVKSSLVCIIIQMLQSEQMTTFLSDEDVLQMQQYFENIPEGKATYTEFYPLAKELILRVYRVKDPSEVLKFNVYTHKPVLQHFCIAISNCEQVRIGKEFYV